MQFLRPLPTTMKGEICDFLGADLSAELATGVAEGYLNPRDYEPYQTSAFLHCCSLYLVDVLNLILI